MDIDEYDELKKTLRAIEKKKLEANKRHREYMRERYEKIKEDPVAYQEYKDKQVERRLEKQAIIDILTEENKKLKQEIQLYKEMIRLAETNTI